jgi:hypothetical protein
MGVLILLLGLGGAGVVYWTGAPPEDFSADPSTARAYRTESRDLEINFGKMGLVMNDLLDDLTHPRTQAAVIAVASMLVASGCFCFAQWLERGGESDDPVA